jgi:hypothetical protein
MVPALYWEVDVFARAISQIAFDISCNVFSNDVPALRWSHSA